LQKATHLGLHLASRFGVAAVIAAFEAAGSHEGLLQLTASLLEPADPLVHTKYVEAAARLSHVETLERATRELSAYDVEKTLALLDELCAADPRPLINVCDKHDRVAHLTSVLYGRGQLNYLNLFIQRVHPVRAPEAVGKLFEVGAPDDAVARMILPIREAAIVHPMITTASRHAKLPVLRRWLEACRADGVAADSEEIEEALREIDGGAGRAPRTWWDVITSCSVW
jgi:clathrin heavy chain